MGAAYVTALRSVMGLAVIRAEDCPCSEDCVFRSSGAGAARRAAAGAEAADADGLGGRPAAASRGEERGEAGVEGASRAWRCSSAFSRAASATACAAPTSFLAC